MKTILITIVLILACFSAQAAEPTDLQIAQAQAFLARQQYLAEKHARENEERYLRQLEAQRQADLAEEREVRRLLHLELLRRQGFKGHVYYYNR
jgi:hypothetical protein